MIGLHKTFFSGVRHDFQLHQNDTQLREDFKQLLAFVTGPQAQTATMDQMERSLLRQVLHMGYQLLRLFVTSRAEAESYKPAGEK